MNEKKIAERVSRSLMAETRVLTVGQIDDSLSDIKKQLDKTTRKPLKQLRGDVDKIFNRTQEQLKRLSQLKADAATAETGGSRIEQDIEEVRQRMFKVMWAIDDIHGLINDADSKTENAQRIMG